jgi:prephenate dehydrogenase
VSAEQAAGQAGGRALGTVKIVGVGLLGTSLALALGREQVRTLLADRSASNLRLAIEYGAGEAFQAGTVGGAAETELDVVVVCVPPDFVAEVVSEQLVMHPRAIVTDVASVKTSVLAELRELVDDTTLERYLGSHPMAGRERGGPGSARADLFFARPWVVSTHPLASARAVSLVTALARTVGSQLVTMPVEDHDAAVALVSHLPQLVSSLVAGRLAEAPGEHLALAGQGLRDTTRIAGSDADLWLQILSRNAQALGPLVTALRTDLEAVERRLGELGQPGALADLHRALTSGNRGASRIPGKHGGKYVNYTELTVMIDDRPGELARLLSFVGEIGVNLEDMSLEHSPGAQIGLVELSVMPEVAQKLTAALEEAGWRLA